MSKEKKKAKVEVADWIKKLPPLPEFEDEEDTVGIFLKRPAPKSE